MSLVFELGPSSATAVTLRPEYDYKPNTTKIQSVNRMKSGRVSVYDWGSYLSWEFSVQFVPVADAANVNSWWQSNADLLFFITSNGVTEVNSVRLMGEGKPLAEFNKSGADYMKGKVLLEGY